MQALEDHKISPIVLNSIPVLVSIHMQAFQGFFLTFLGSKFLSVVYSSILKDPSGIALAAWQGNQIIGFVFGSTQPQGLYRRLLIKHWWQFGWAAFPVVIQNPKVIPRLLRAFTISTEALPVAGCATLMSIAVIPDSQNSGAGKALVEEFLFQCKQRGVLHVNLTTDATNNEKVNRFYQKMGFQLYKKFTTPQGREMNEYLIAL